MQGHGAASNQRRKNHDKGNAAGDFIECFVKQCHPPMLKLKPQSAPALLQQHCPHSTGQVPEQVPMHQPFQIPPQSLTTKLSRL